MSNLILKNIRGEGSTYPINKIPFKIGRDQKNDVVLESKIVSREHAQIKRAKEGLAIVDRDSHNGTFVNGTRIKEVLLRDGDEILVGETLILYQETIAEDIHFSADDSLLDSKATIIRPIEDLAIIEPLRSEVQPPRRKDQRIDQLERNNQNLIILYQLSEKLISSITLRELLDMIIELIFKSIDADRGFLMLIDEGEKLIPKVIKYRDSSSNGDEKITISQTIVNRVVQDRVAILTSDAMVDPRFNEGESIYLHGIRSAICVPLWRGKDIIGIIHLDSFRQANQFTENDLELLMAIANHAAIGIEQARLNEKILRETQIRSNLERFHSPDVVNTIMKESAEGGTLSLKVEEKVATALFLDIQNFTLLAERLSPPEVASLLNEYFSIMTDIIFEYDGTLDKYIGDAIMATFGAPYSHGNDAEKAVLAALKMRQELKRLMNRKEEKRRFDVRIGINSGNVVAGYIGSTKRLEYTVLGDVVNVASYLESIAEPNEILIGEETFRQVNKLFFLEEAGKKKVKRGTSEVRFYRVIGEK
ncbi:MAG: FHA domain-containing protein [Syntrophobacterales bacterium]|nr:MAG: FHA domain-containing protein [Syntrophobacterales bacterium]